MLRKGKRLLTYSSPPGPHLDFLTATFQRGQYPFIHSGILPLMTSISGIDTLQNGTYSFPDHPGKLRFQENSRSPNRCMLTVSGKVISRLRQSDIIDHLLAVMSDYPHKLTSIDVAYDLPLDTLVIQRKLLRKAKSSNGIKLGRKRIKNVRSYRGDLLANDSGTLYLGQRTNELYAKVYDKRMEVLSKTGIDIGPMTRYELTASCNVGITLSDAQRPEGLFWHFMSDVLRRPEGLPEWVPGETGFSTGKIEKALPAALLRDRVASSAEVGYLVDLALQSGEKGPDYLLNLIRRRLDAASSPS